MGVVSIGNKYVITIKEKGIGVLVVAPIRNKRAKTDRNAFFVVLVFTLQGPINSKVTIGKSLQTVVIFSQLSITVPSQCTKGYIDPLM